MSDPRLPEPLRVHYSRWKATAVAAFVTVLVAGWAWRSYAAWAAAPQPSLRLWLLLLGSILLTGVFATGVVALMQGTPAVLLVDEHGITFPEAYEDTVPWTAIASITRNPARGVMFEVTEGSRFGRKLSRSVRPAMRPGANDTVTVRAGLLDTGAHTIETSMIVWRDRTLERRPG